MSAAELGLRGNVANLASVKIETVYSHHRRAVNLVNVKIL